MTKNLEQVLWEKVKKGDEVFIIDPAARNTDFYSGPHVVENPDIHTLIEYGTGKLFVTFTSLVFKEKEE